MSGKHAAPVPDHVRLCGGDKPWLSYLDHETGIGFEWTGRPADPIEVHAGGFDEPITHLIIRTPEGQSLREVLTDCGQQRLAAMWAACDLWLLEINGPSWASKEPPPVTEVAHG
jgi:hypothetical protein